MNSSDEATYDAVMATKRLRDICKSKETPDMVEVARLIQAGANINDTDSSGRSLLHELVDTDHADLALYLLGKGANMELRTPGNLNNTPLLYATWSRPNTKMAKLFIEAGASLFAQDSVGDTAIHNAGLKNMAEVAAHAMAVRDDIRTTILNNSGNTALGNAVNSGHPDTAEALIRNGWPIDEKVKAHKPYSYQGVEDRYKRSTDLVSKAVSDAHDRWIDFLHHRHGDVTSLTREDICSFANIDAHEEIFAPSNWREHRAALTNLMGSLPPWLARSIITRHSALLGMIDNPDRLISTWDSRLDGRMADHAPEQQRA